MCDMTSTNKKFSAVIQAVTHKQIIYSMWKENMISHLHIYPTLQNTIQIESRKKQCNNCYWSFRRPTYLYIMVGQLFEGKIYCSEKPKQSGGKESVIDKRNRIAVKKSDARISNRFHSMQCLLRWRIPSKDGIMLIQYADYCDIVVNQKHLKSRTWRIHVQDRIVFVLK